MSVAPVMPVVTGTNLARSLPFIFVGDEHALHRVGFGRRRGGCRLNAALVLDVVHCRIVHGQRLNGQRKHIRLVGGGDLGGAGEAGAQFVGGTVESDHDLEVLGLFGAGGGLRGGDAG